MCVLALSLQDFILGAEAATIRLHNQCGTTVCARSWVPNSIGAHCSPQGAGSTWSVSVGAKWMDANIWAVTGGCGSQVCQRGPPSGVTQFEFTIAGFDGYDHYDVSTIAGFNFGMHVVPTNGGCPSIVCRGRNAATCPSGYHPGVNSATKTCRTGTTDYHVYLCG
ncbi:hypothetical protein L7F22_045159 [Adiantum nelumboides]|nr:hypothetical protein [Adiantum nelumboides]